MRTIGIGVASSLASRSGLILLGNLFMLITGIPLQIYLARTLGADQLGALGLFESIAQAAMFIFGFGLGFALVRFIPQHITLGQNQHVKKLLAKVFSMTLFGGIFAAILLTCSSHLLMSWVPKLLVYEHLFPFIGAMTVLGMLTGISKQALCAFLDIRFMVLVSSCLQITLKIFITVILLFWGMELMGYLLAVVLSAAFALAVMLWCLHGHIQRLGQTKEEVLNETRRNWWSYSRTMYADSLLDIAGAPAERFVLASLLNLASVGAVMVVRQLQSLPQVLLQIMVVAIAPMIVAANARNDMNEVKYLYQMATDWVCRLGFPLLIFLLVFGKEVLMLYGDTFAEMGRWPLLIMLAGQFVNLLTGPIGIMINMLGHEKKKCFNSP